MTESPAPHGVTDAPPPMRLGRTIPYPPGTTPAELVDADRRHALVRKLADRLVMEATTVAAGGYSTTHPGVHLQFANGPARTAFLDLLAICQCGSEACTRRAAWLLIGELALRLGDLSVRIDETMRLGRPS